MAKFISFFKRTYVQNALERKTFDQNISVALIDYKKLMYVQASKQGKEALTRLEKNVCESTKGKLNGIVGKQF